MAFRKFRNDKERKAFLDDFHNTDNGWIIWKFDTELERQWWRLELTNTIAIVVEEERRTYKYPEYREVWTPIQWFITDQKIAEYQCGDEVPHFGDYRTSKGRALEYIKAAEKGEL